MGSADRWSAAFLRRTRAPDQPLVLRDFLEKTFAGRFAPADHAPMTECCTPRKSMLRNMKPLLYPAAWAFRRLHVLLHCAMLRAYCDE